MNPRLAWMIRYTGSNGYPSPESPPRIREAGHTNPISTTCPSSHANEKKSLFFVILNLMGLGYTKIYTKRSWGHYVTVEVDGSRLETFCCITEPEYWGA